MTPTCTVCELHAESTFKIEGMDCREEVALLERRFKNLRRPRGFLRRPDGPAAAREVRRRQALGRDDRRRRRRHRHARVARARGAGRRQRSADARRGRRWSGRRASRSASAWRCSSPAPIGRRRGVRSPPAARSARCSCSSLAAGVGATARKAWSALRARVARHQRADARRRRRRGGARRVVRGGGGGVPVRASRRRSKRGRSTARATRSAR